MAIKVSFALCVTHKMSLIWIRSDWTKAIFLNSVLLTFRDSRIVAFIVFRQNWKYLWQDTFIQKMTDTWFTVSNCKNLWLERGGLEKENILHGARYQFVDGTTPSRTRLTGPVSRNIRPLDGGTGALILLLLFSESEISLSPVFLQSERWWPRFDIFLNKICDMWYFQYFLHSSRTENVFKWKKRILGS